MHEFDLFLILFAIVSIIGIIFKNRSAPLSLFLLIAGMLLSLLPFIPPMGFNPTLVLDVFLPLLIYEMTSETGWRDVKPNLGPILSLSIGHVVFITLLVAGTVHWILPELGWPIAFIIGAVVSPPDDVAIMPLIEKGAFPQRLVTLLKSEAIFNDSMALIIFRFSLVALLTHEFSILNASLNFSFIVIGETIYGILLGYFLGTVRTRIEDPRVQMITSFLSPFIAYLPSVRMGGCGVLATAVMGLVIRHRFLNNFTPEARLVSRSVWTSLSFAIESVLFLLVGLDLHFVLKGISSIPTFDLLTYALVVIGTVIIGRFIWVFSTIRWSHPPTPWAYCLVISWSGMRGAISLAAVLSVPHVGIYVFGANIRDLLIFLVFCVILATLILQGLTLPWLLQWFGISRYHQEEKREDSLIELSTRIKLSHAVLDWLKEYKETLAPNNPLLAEVKFYMRKYQITQNQFEDNIKSIVAKEEHEWKECRDGVRLGDKILQIERSELARLWDQNEVSNAVRNKLLLELDYRSKL